MVLTLLSRILVWAAVGLFVWYVLLKFIRRPFLAWFGGVILLTVIVWSYVDPNDETIGAIWNIISFPLTPLGFSLTLLTFSFKEFPFKEGFKVTNGRYVAVALLILSLCSVPLVARFFVNQAEESVQRAYAAQQAICADVCPVEIPDAPLSRVVTIVVVGENLDAIAPPTESASRTDNQFNLSPILVSRLSSAASLYQRVRQTGTSPFVFVTAGSIMGSSEEQVQKDQVLIQVLASNGVPSEVIRINDNGTNVHATMEEVRDFLIEQGLISPDLSTRLEGLQRDSSRIALVAPAISMRRSALTFEQQGLEVVAWPTNLYGTEVDTGDTLALLSDLVPNVEALRLTTRYWNEVLTSFYYFLRGWLPGFDVRWNEVVELVPQ